RKHHSLTSIVLVNLFFGWTLVGWVAAIAWACAGSDKRATTPERKNAQERQEPAAAAPSPAPPLTTLAVSVADELQKLGELRDRGILTEDEYQAQKAKALNELP